MSANINLFNLFYSIMAFTATLSFNGKEFDVQKWDVGLRRDVDAKGRPSSDIYGGKVTVTIESTEDTSIIEAMVNQYKPCSGNIVFNKGNEAAKMKELIWENGYIIDFKEEIDVIGKQPMLLTFTVSAQVLKMGAASIEQNWPTDR
ncbi:MAG: type VI secretion system needle protein Hcp [Tannerella sp.]|jgi:hypothetical protein|nr:type VI secretion system needle protein Hcp [Tannerella sp.]